MKERIWVHPNFKTLMKKAAADDRISLLEYTEKLANEGMDPTDLRRMDETKKRKISFKFG